MSRGNGDRLKLFFAMPKLMLLLAPGVRGADKKLIISSSQLMVALRTSLGGTLVESCFFSHCTIRTLMSLSGLFVCVSSSCDRLNTDFQNLVLRRK